MSCPSPRVTRRVFNAGRGAGPMAWCGKCQAWKPAEQVSWSRMQRNRAGRVTATFAPLPH